MEPTHLHEEQPETSLRELEHCYNFLRSDEWRFVSGLLNENLSMIENLSNIEYEGKNFAELGEIAAARIGAVSLVREWVADIETRATNYVNIVHKDEATEEGYVVRQ